MAKAFSLASWNVEHFRRDQQRVGRVVDFVDAQRPDVFALYEVEGGKSYSMLFLHTKSGNDPKGMGLRDDMLKRACKFRRKLDKAAGGRWKANYLFLGDLNTMGMRYPFDQNIGADVELRKLAREAARVKMKPLTKDAPATWWNGSSSRYKPADLDHVVASEHLEFKGFSGADVTVRGWPEEETEAKQDRWIRDFSDHGLLYLEVQKQRDVEAACYRSVIR